MPSDESAKAVEPREEPLNVPAPPVALHAAVVGSRLLGAVGPVLREQQDVDASEGGAQFTGVVCLGGDDPPRPARGLGPSEPRYFFDGGLRERRLAFVRSCEVNSERKTLADGQNSKLRSLSPLGEADCVAPFSRSRRSRRGTSLPSPAGPSCRGCRAPRATRPSRRRAPPTSEGGADRSHTPDTSSAAPSTARRSSGSTGSLRGSRVAAPRSPAPVLASR